MVTGPDRKSLQELLHDEMIDGIDEELELEIDDDLLPHLPEGVTDEIVPADAGPAMNRRRYFSELLRLQRELVNCKNG